MSILLIAACLTGQTGWSAPFEFCQTEGATPDHLSIAAVQPGPSDPVYIHQCFDLYNYLETQAYSIFTLPFSPVVFLQDPGLDAEYIELLPYEDGVLMIGVETQAGVCSLAILDRSATGDVEVPVRRVCPMEYGTIIDAAADSNGVVQAVTSDIGCSIYLAIDADPDSPVILWQDTLSSESGSAIAVDDHVHILFRGADNRTDYIQYDLAGNVTIPATDVVMPGEFGDCDCASLALTGSGDVRVFLLTDGTVVFCGIDGDTGQRQFDPVVIDNSQAGLTSIERCGVSDDSYLIWLDSGYGHKQKVRFRVVDDQGGTLYDPGPVYSYAEDRHNLQHLDTCSDPAGFVYLTTFHCYTTPPPIQVPWVYPIFGYFTPGLGFEEAEASDPLRLDASENPFRSGVDLMSSGSETFSEVEILDATGRRIRTLEPSVDGIVSWDGRDAAGSPAANGIYFAVAVDGDEIAFCRLVKL